MDDFLIYCRANWKSQDEQTGEIVTLGCPLKESCHRYKQRLDLPLYTYFDKVPWSLLKPTDKAECKYYWENRKESRKNSI